MPDYQKGKIYCIRSHQTDKVYVGSTVQELSMRMCGHRKDFKNYKNGKYCYVTSFDILDYDDAYIELIEDFPSENRNQLEKREGVFIREMECVNKIIVGRDIKEYKEANKDKLSDYFKKRYESNKDKIKEIRKEYQEANKDKIKQRNKEYHEANKDKKKEYREANKDMINQKKRDRRLKKKQESNSI